MRTPVAILAVLALWGAPARAEKRHVTAQILSGIGVGASSALVVSSFLFRDTYHPVNEPMLYTGLVSSVITPSLGEWYAGDWLTIGMAVRVGAVGLATFAVAHEQHDAVCYSMPGQNCREFSGTGIALLGLAAIAYVGGAVYDVVDAPAAVDRYNQRHGVFVAPTALATPLGLAPGVYFSATY
jgi:hypothetical protein